jgi:peptidyl-Lys metalloendopeptidase
MSTVLRTVCLSTGLIVLAGTLTAGRPAAAESTLANPLRISMIADSSSRQPFMGTVEFKITNSSSQTLKIPSWNLPSNELSSNQFEIYNQGHRATYLGKMIHHTAPTEADLVTFKAYETKVIRVDLGQSYDLSATGDYSVKFKSFVQDAKTDNGRRVAGANGRMAKLETSCSLKATARAARPSRVVAAPSSTA